MFYRAQYGGLSVKTSLAFHDRFLIIDDKELYLIGASVKHLPALVRDDSRPRGESDGAVDDDSPLHG